MTRGRIDVETLLDRVRRNLAWLTEDGYRETKVRVGRSVFDLTFEGPHGQIIVTVYPGMSELEIWLTPPDTSGQRAAMQEYLAARGLPAPDPRIDATTMASVERAVDENAAALKLLRDKELAGDWTRLDDQEGLADAVRRRGQLVDEIVDRVAHGDDGTPSADRRS